MCSIIHYASIRNVNRGSDHAKSKCSPIALPATCTIQKALFQSRVESLGHVIAETDDEYWRLVLEFRRGEMEAIVRWLDRCLQTR